MPGYLRNTIVALTEELAAEHNPLPDASPKLCEEISRFVLEQMNRMPWFLALGVKSLTSVFGMSRLFLGGGLFFRQPSQLRRLHMRRWSRSRFQICRVLMKFYLSLVLLVLYSRPEADRTGDLK